MTPTFPTAEDADLSTATDIPFTFTDGRIPDTVRRLTSAEAVDIAAAEALAAADAPALVPVLALAPVEAEPDAVRRIR